MSAGRIIWLGRGLPLDPRPAVVGPAEGEVAEGGEVGAPTVVVVGEHAGAAFFPDEGRVAGEEETRGEPGSLHRG